MSDRWDKMLDELRGQAAAHISGVVRERLGEAMGGAPQREPRRNPFSPGEPDDYDVRVGEEEDEEDGGEGGYSFERPGAKDNLAGAVGAYRLLGTEGDVVAQHKATGYALFGTEAELEEYIAQRDLRGDWDVWDDPYDILDMEADEATMRDILAAEADGAMDKSREQFEGFHWGDRSQITTFKTIPGINSPLTLLGVGRRLDYYARKEGEDAEYYHHFGEESKTWPAVYALGVDTIVIHGGGMRITDRGVVD